jgi:hypothetical protein
MWNVPGTTVNPDWLDLEPVRVLYNFDFPRIYICKDTPGNLYLAYVCGEEPEELRYLVVRADDDLETKLIRGQINLHDALTPARAWIFDLRNSWVPIRAWQVDPDSLPSEVLPRPGVMLYSHLQPVVISARPRSCSNDTEVTISEPAAIGVQSQRIQKFSYA